MKWKQFAALASRYRYGKILCWLIVTLLSGLSLSSVAGAELGPADSNGDPVFRDRFEPLSFAIPVVDETSLSASSYLSGGSDSESVYGSVIQPDGTIVLAANLGPDLPDELTPVYLNGTDSSDPGSLVRLSPDGRQVLSVTRISSQVTDLSADAQGNLYVAAWEAGIVKMNPQASAVLWQIIDSNGRNAWRVDAADDGTAAGLFHNSSASNPQASNPGSGRIRVMNGEGEILGDLQGYRNTLDVAVHSASQTVVRIGWRQASAWDGNKVQPVQIAYLRGSDYGGEVKYTAYDWSTDRESEDFINRPRNNMADTRGIRASIGRDGYLYAAFEAAGGNHIFRHATFDIVQQVSIVGGDRFHEFYNSKSEHKTFFARYEAASGEYVLGQQLCGRLKSGAANTVRPLAIEADESGRVFIGGAAAAGLPLSWNPPGTGDYSGGSWLMIMSGDFSVREFTTRMAPNRQTLTVATRRTGTQQRVVMGGQVASSLHTKNAVQPASVSGNDGFFTVFAP